MASTFDLPGTPPFVLNESAVRYHRTKTKGDAAEAMALAAFIIAGFAVSRPVSENCAYDLVVDDAGRLAKVQVKWARTESGYVRFWTSTMSRGTNRSYTANECDFFAAYAGDNGSLYVLPFCDVGNLKCVQLRTDEPRNGQRAGIRWARDHAFNGVLPWPGP